MRKEGKGKEYASVLKYLKDEEPEYFERFKKGYFGQKTALPGLTEQQYLILLLQHADKRKRTFLESVDGSLTDDGEIKELEMIIRRSKKMTRIIQNYKEVRELPYVTRQDREKLDRQVAKQVYESMDEEDRKQYNTKRLIVIMPKLNIGPWKQGSNGDFEGNGNIDDFLIRNRAIFEENPDLPKKILERICQQELNSTKSFSEARKVLRKLTS